MEIETIHLGSFKTDKLISVSLFRMIDTYKNPLKYYIWLLEFVKNMNEINPTFKIAIFIDLSVTRNPDGTPYDYGVKMIEQLKNNNKLDIYLYNDERFKINKYYHDGTYGTFIRFLPSFNHNNFSKYKIVYISDIDFTLQELIDYKKIYTKFEKSKCKFSFVNSNICYPKPWVTKKQKFIILGGMIFSKIKLPENLLNDYLNKLNKNKIDLSQLLKDRRTKNEKTGMPYGIDELFLNTIIYNYLLKNKIKILLINNNSTISWEKKIKYNINDIKDLNNKNIIDKAKKILKNKNKLIKKYPNINKDYLISCPQNIIKNKNVLNKLTTQIIN